VTYQDELRNLIRRRHRRLQLLKEQQASFGQLHTPVHISTEIEDTEAEIHKLQSELAEIESGADTLAQRVQAQRRRIAEGLEELRQQATAAPAFEQRQIRVVGRPPLGTVEHFKSLVRAGDYDNACRVLEPIDFDYPLLWGHYTRLIEMREKLKGHLIDLSLQAYNLGSLGNAYYFLGQPERAIKLHERALDVARKAGDRRGEGIWKGYLGLVYHGWGSSNKPLNSMNRPFLSSVNSMIVGILDAGKAISVVPAVT
jgi:tetratricopeptide (TPR) repeat protein